MSPTSLSPIIQLKPILDKSIDSKCILWKKFQWNEFAEGFESFKNAYISRLYYKRFLRKWFCSYELMKWWINTAIKRIRQISLNRVKMKNGGPKSGICHTILVEPLEVKSKGYEPGGNYFSLYSFSFTTAWMFLLQMILIRRNGLQYFSNFNDSNNLKIYNYMKKSESYRNNLYKLLCMHQRNNHRL